MDIYGNNVSKNLITLLLPTSPAAEAYRILRTNLQYTSIDKKIKSIIITSPEILDGKTVTSCNLAISISSTGKKVLLVDADLRKPNVHNQFKIKNYVGLSNIIVNGTELDDALHGFKDIPNLSVLTSGTVPPNPSELLSSNKIKGLVLELTEMFDMIIIDTSPIGLVTDGIILSKVVDGVILSISSNKTKISSTQNAIRSLRRVDANILGVIMTKTNTNKKMNYGYK